MVELVDLRMLSTKCTTVLKRDPVQVFGVKVSCEYSVSFRGSEKMVSILES